MISFALITRPRIQSVRLLDLKAYIIVVMLVFSVGTMLTDLPALGFAAADAPLLPVSPGFCSEPVPCLLSLT